MVLVSAATMQNHYAQSLKIPFFCITEVTVVSAHYTKSKKENRNICHFVGLNFHYTLIKFERTTQVRDVGIAVLKLYYHELYTEYCFAISGVTKP